jgi:hypothetical protein
MTRKVGEIAALFRYPVKSMRGEALEQAELAWHGLSARAHPARPESARPGNAGSHGPSRNAPNASHASPARAS